MSPDPAIRNIAIRRREIDEEAGRLDGFLQLYSDLPANSVTRGVHPQRDSVMSRPAPRFAGDFVAMVRAVLREAGRPLMLDELYTAFWARLPEQTPSIKESFRQKLKENRMEIIVLPNKRGYWLADTPLPEGFGVAACATPPQ